MEVLNNLPIIQQDPDPQTRRRKIHCKQELIVSSLQRFYSTRDDVDEILKLLDGTSNISLRLIDWFVTNYAKLHNISYILNGQEFLVYTNYKSQLKAYSKKLFDPFCRRERIMFQIPGHPMFQTTVGKLNFFRWAIEKGVIDYIKLNLSKIETAMNTNAREIQKVRKALSASTTGSSATTISTVAESVLSNASASSSGGSVARNVTRKRVSTAQQQAQQLNSKLMQKHEYDVEVRFD